ncbi:hypothetical protein MMC17_002855 [Xylographa soralifera]|nr:hypothetical protein [Xylographa soralifera]
MAAPILPGFFTHLVYPATLTVFGMVGNAYILGNQIKDVRDDLGGQIKDVKDDLGGQIKEVNHEIKALTARQTELAILEMSIAEKLFKGCG